MVAQSITESEYIAASEAAQEAVWIRKFIVELGVIPSIEKPIEMYCDNVGALVLAKELRVHKGSRHILRKFHYVREVVRTNEISVLKVHTDQNLADPFTKPMPHAKHDEHARGIGLRSASSLLDL